MLEALIVMAVILVANIVFLILAYKKLKAIELSLNGRVNETQSRIKAISNALPRTPKEGGLGYRINLK